MTKLEFINSLYSKTTDLSSDDVRVGVDVILDSITEGLAEGKRVEIRGFGSFSLRYRNSRIGRNPRTGGSVNVAEKCFPYFKPGRELRQRVDSGSD